MKVVKLSSLRTGRLYSTGNIPGTYLCWRLSKPQDHSAVGRIMSMKNSNYTIGNRTRDLPTCSAVPQSTSSPLTPHFFPVTNQKRRFVPMKLFCIFLYSKCNSMQQVCLRVLVPCLLSVYIMSDISNSVVQSFNVQGE